MCFKYVRKTSLDELLDYFQPSHSMYFHMHLNILHTLVTKCAALHTEMRFASLLSGGFITAIVVNPPERKLAKRTSVVLSGSTVSLLSKLDELSF